MKRFRESLKRRFSDKNKGPRGREEAQQPLQTQQPPAQVPNHPEPAQPPAPSGGIAGTTANTLQIALVNRFSTSTPVFATVSGRALDNNNALVLIQADGQSLYFPTSPSSTGADLGADCAIRLGGAGSTTNVTVPHMAGARIYFSVGSPLTFLLNPGPALVEPSVTNPSDPNIDLDWGQLNVHMLQLYDHWHGLGFCEFTFNTDQLYANISYVDFVSSIPIALNLTTRNSGTLNVGGLAPDGLNRVCSGLQAQHAADGRAWDQLVKTKDGRNLRALSPNLGQVGNGDLFAGYFEPYVDEVWARYQSSPISIDTQAGFGTVESNVTDGVLNFQGSTFSKPSTSDIFTCSTGPFATGQDARANAIIPRLAAAFNRSTLLKTNVSPAPQELYYQEAITNHYSRIVHQSNIDGRGYAFPYDDVQPSGGADQSGEVHAGDPVLWTVSVGS
jgi:hypothetical protein